MHQLKFVSMAPPCMFEQFAAQVAAVQTAAPPGGVTLNPKPLLTAVHLLTLTTFWQPELQACRSPILAFFPSCGNGSGTAAAHGAAPADADDGTQIILKLRSNSLKVTLK